MRIKFFCVLLALSACIGESETEVADSALIYSTFTDQRLLDIRSTPKMQTTLVDASYAYVSDPEEDDGGRLTVYAPLSYYTWDFMTEGKRYVFTTAQKAQDQNKQFVPVYLSLWCQMNRRWQPLVLDDGVTPVPLTHSVIARRVGNLMEVSTFGTAEATVTASCGALGLFPLVDAHESGSLILQLAHNEV